MINRNLSSERMFDQEPCSWQELEKAVSMIGLSVFTSDEVGKFVDDLNDLIKKGESMALTQDELDAIEKGKRDLSKLVKKEVVDRNGKKTTKWVKVKESKPAEDGKKDDSQSSPSGKKYNHQHAAEATTEQLEKYINEGDDEDLKLIAKHELRQRKFKEGREKHIENKRAEKEANKNPYGDDKPKKRVSILDDPDYQNTYGKDSGERKPTEDNSAIPSDKYNKNQRNQSGSNSSNNRSVDPITGLNLSKTEVSAINSVGSLQDFKKVRDQALANNDDVTPVGYVELKMKESKQSGNKASNPHKEGTAEYHNHEADNTRNSPKERDEHREKARQAKNGSTEDSKFADVNQSKVTRHLRKLWGYGDYGLKVKTRKNGDVAIKIINSGMNPDLDTADKYDKSTSVDDVKDSHEYKSLSSLSTKIESSSSGFSGRGVDQYESATTFVIPKSNVSKLLSIKKESAKSYAPDLQKAFDSFNIK